MSFVMTLLVAVKALRRNAMRTALTDVLTAEGYRVLTAADGEEGLRRALNEAPALVLLDPPHCLKKTGTLARAH